MEQAQIYDGLRYLIFNEIFHNSIKKLGVFHFYVGIELVAILFIVYLFLLFLGVGIPV